MEKRFETRIRRSTCFSQLLFPNLSIIINDAGERTKPWCNDNRLTDFIFCSLYQLAVWGWETQVDKSSWVRVGWNTWLNYRYVPKHEVNIFVFLGWQSLIVPHVQDLESCVCFHLSHPVIRHLHALQETVANAKLWLSALEEWQDCSITRPCFYGTTPSATADSVVYKQYLLACANYAHPR